METICEVGSKSVNGFKKASSLHLNQSAEVKELCYIHKKIETCLWIHFPRISASGFETEMILLRLKYLPKEKLKYFIFN